MVAVATRSMMMMLESPAGPPPPLDPGPRGRPMAGVSDSARSPTPQPATICLAPGKKLYHSTAEAKSMTTQAIVCFHQLIEISDFLCQCSYSGPDLSSDYRLSTATRSRFHQLYH